MNPNLTFEQWKRVVDLLIEKKLGFDSEFLPDAPFHTWYVQGMRPALAATKTIKAAKEY